MVRIWAAPTEMSLTWRSKLALLVSLGPTPTRGAPGCGLGSGSAVLGSGGAAGSGGTVGADALRNWCGAAGCSHGARVPWATTAATGEQQSGQGGESNQADGWPHMARGLAVGECALHDRPPRTST